MVKGEVVPALTKHHAMTAYLLNEAPRYEEILGSGGIAPRILNIDIRWR
jgi:hypothetical protein